MLLKNKNYLKSNINNYFKYYIITFVIVKKIIDLVNVFFHW